MKEVLLVFILILPVLVMQENVDSVYTGPFVDVIPNSHEIEVGSETTFSVFVYEMDGEEQVPKDLIEVTISATEGSFVSDTGITDQNGYCTFTYNSPGSIEGPTEVNITATADIGPLGSTTGHEKILITYKLAGRIEGPSMLKKGSTVTTYTVNVTANGEPMENVNIMPTVFGCGTLDSYSRHTGPDGTGSLRILPSGDSTGQINVLVQLGLTDHLRSAVSRIIQVVEELAPMNISISADHDPLRWGSCHLTAEVSRGEYPESGVAVNWEVSAGYVSSERTTTNESGRSTVIFTAVPDEGMNWPDHIVVNITASQAEVMYYAEKEIPLDEEELSLVILNGSEFSHRVRHSQLYPGEELIMDLDLFYRSYQYHDWELGWDMRLDLHLYHGQDLYLSRTLETDLNTLEDDIVELDEKAVWTVPQDISEGNYTWSLSLTDRDGNHEYWSHLSDKPLLLRRQGREDWTIMYYFAGRNNLALSMDRSINKLRDRAPDGEYKVFCNYDRSNDYDDPYHVKWDGTKYFDLEEGYSRDDTMFGPNTGKPDTLVRFMEWATGISTTGMYCLVYCDHGAAHKGIGIDEYWKDHLTIWELRDALGSFSQIRRDLEVFVMDACHMASLEVANSLYDNTRYQVFSQLPIYTGYSFDNDKALRNLNSYDWDSEGPNAMQVATDYLNSFIQLADGTDYDSPAMVLDSERVYQLAHLFNDAMRAIYQSWDLLGECFDVVFEDARRLEGPYSDQWNLTDMKNMLILLRDELSDYILDPSGRSAFNKVGEVIDYFDSVRAYYHPMEDLNGLNVFLPDHMEPSGSPFSEGLPLIGHHDHDYWLKVLDILWHGNYQRDDILDPLRRTGYTVIDEPGQPSLVQVDLTLEDNGTETVLIRATQWSSMGSMGNLSALSVLEGDELNEGDIQVELKVPSTDLYSISVTALDHNGDVMTSRLLGHERMNGTNSDPPDIQLEASVMEAEVGNVITFDCTTSEENEIYWDLDHRDGIYIGSSGPVVERSYRRSGNVTVTCMVVNESGTSVDHLHLSILPAANNTDPVPILTAGPAGGLNVTFDAADSLDPEDDTLEYRFNFGDGNWTGWSNMDRVTHGYGSEGAYNCSLKVRDGRGGESDRTFLLLEIDENHSVNSPPVAVYEKNYKIVEGESLVLDLSDSYDPEGGDLEIKVDWGDGTETGWTSSLILEHNYDTAGVYEIGFQIRDDHNNTEHRTINVTLIEEIDSHPTSPVKNYYLLGAAVSIAVLLLLVIVILVIVKKKGGPEE